MIKYLGKVCLNINAIMIFNGCYSNDQSKWELHYVENNSKSGEENNGEKKSIGVITYWSYCF